MNDVARCALCGRPIEVGEAWMRADENGAEVRAHAGCVYRDAPDPQSMRAWEPGDAAT